MTISILKDILIKYTIENSVGINKSKFTKSKLKNVFDVNSNSWLDKDALLPVYNGIPVIFLPKNLLRKKSGVNCTLRSFYCFGIVNDIINDASYKELAIPTGKNGNYLLSDIKLVFSCTKFNILTLGLRKLNSLIDFNQVHNKRLKSLTDEDIESIISKSGK